MNSRKNSSIRGCRSALINICLIILVALFLIWLIGSGMKIPLSLSIIAIFLAGIYLAINFEKAYLPFLVVIILPLAIFITAVPNLNAYELVVPGFFILGLIHTMILKESSPGVRVLPISIIIFFTLGLIVYLRDPSLPPRFLPVPPVSVISGGTGTSLSGL